MVILSAFIVRIKCRTSNFLCHWLIASLTNYVRLVVEVSLHDFQRKPISLLTARSRLRCFQLVLYSTSTDLTRGPVTMFLRSLCSPNVALTEVHHIFSRVSCENKPSVTVVSHSDYCRLCKNAYLGLYTRRQHSYVIMKQHTHMCAPHHNGGISKQLKNARSDCLNT